MKCLANSTEKVRKQAIEDASYALMVSVASVLTDKLHFGKKKTEQTLNQIMDRFDSIARDYVTVEELSQTLIDEYGIHISIDRRH